MITSSRGLCSPGSMPSCATWSIRSFHRSTWRYRWSRMRRGRRTSRADCRCRRPEDHAVPRRAGRHAGAGTGVISTGAFQGRCAGTMWAGWSRPRCRAWIWCICRRYRRRYPSGRTRITLRCRARGRCMRTCCRRRPRRCTCRPEFASCRWKCLQSCLDAADGRVYAFDRGASSFSLSAWTRIGATKISLRSLRAGPCACSPYADFSQGQRASFSQTPSSRL